MCYRGFDLAINASSDFFVTSLHNTTCLLVLHVDMQLESTPRKDHLILQSQPMSLYLKYGVSTTLLPTRA